MSIEDRIKELGMELPQIPTPMANYIPAKKVGRIVFVSGQSARRPDGTLPFVGKLGRDLSIEEGYQSAKEAVLNCLAAVKSLVGSLDEIDEIVRVRGFVNCTPEFGQQPEVINGASDTLVQIFGEKGRHSRSALGSAALPRGVATEVELVVALKE